MIRLRYCQQRKVLATISILTVVCLFQLLNLRSIPEHRRPTTDSSLSTSPATTASVNQEAAEHSFSSDIGYLQSKDLDLSEKILYSQRCITVTYDIKTSSARKNNKQDHRRITKIPGPLVRSPIVINTTSLRSDARLTCDRLSLSVPIPYPKTTYGHLLFGVSSTRSRLYQSIDGFAHWLAGSDAQLIAVVYDESISGSNTQQSHESTLRALEAAYRGRSIRFRAISAANKSLTTAQNHFGILSTLLEAKPAETRWVGLVDDDTFFPSLYKLDRELQSQNHQAPTWLGALSEDSDSLHTWGKMAYGGAGIFLSIPLVTQLVPHIEECLFAPDAPPTGDGILRDCIYRHTSTKLTIVPGLYQHDLYGEISGFYESGFLPLSVHHWRSWYKEPLPKMATISRLCGDCFLQRWQFADNTLLSNGFSVTKYAKSLDNYDLMRMEATWSHRGHEFDGSLGPLRPTVDEAIKKSYRFKTSFEELNGEIRQVYVYKGDLGKNQMDEVIELRWSAPSNHHEEARTIP